MTARQPARLLLFLALVALLVAPFARPLRADDGDDKTPPGDRYGGTPDELVPYRDAGEPARSFFREPPAFRGPDDGPAPHGDAVRLGVIAPLGGVDRAVGARMLHGIELALDEANAAGGFAEGVPFAIVVRDENAAWGAAANALVDLVDGSGIQAVLGALEDSNSHVLTRLLLKLELPMVNTAGPDPTLTEHNIPWLVRLRPDDRQTSYRLVHRIFHEDGHQRVAVFRANDRYGRTGTAELEDAARRLHHPIPLEVRFENGETDVGPAIERLRAARPDAIVMWGRAAPTGRALAALRAAGVDVPVYGPDRLYDPDFLQAAGAAAEGLVFAYPFDPTSDRPAWVDFQTRYRARFGEMPDAVAAYAYDGTRYLLDAIRTAGLDRPRIQRALYAVTHLDGVSGPVRFDTTHNNVTPVILGRVANGAFRFDSR
jgi:branched-chain amino acid transport system substrate-binding protein